MDLAFKLRFLYRAWKYRWDVERREIAFVLRQLRPGQSALDVGAHKGAFTYWMQKAVGRTGKVVAFEPQPELAEYLRRMKRICAFPHVTIVNAALSSSVGVLHLFRPGKSPSPSARLGQPYHNGEEIAVEALTLDAFLADHHIRPIHLIKCDAEGHEAHVLKGAVNVLREDKPTLLLECEQRHHHDCDIRDVFAMLEELGYTGRFFRKDGLRPLREFRPEHNLDPQSPDYVYNFAFRAAA
jgi:FkbM family methyltransferase